MLLENCERRMESDSVDKITTRNALIPTEIKGRLAKECIKDLARKG